MSGNRNAWGAVFALALATAALSCGASNAADEDLVKQVQALTQRIEALEREVTALKSRPAAVPQANAQLEQEAQTALAEINRLVETGSVLEAKGKLGEFQTKYAATRAGQSAGRLVQELAVVGKESPKDWGIEKWFQGEQAINLNAKGATLVVFWETWCPHCRREVPKLQQVYDTYKTKGLQLVGLTKLSKSSTEQDVTSFISENKVSYPMAKENGQSSSYFAVSGIPAAAVVKGGQIVWRGHPGRITDEMIKGWL